MNLFAIAIIANLLNPPQTPVLWEEIESECSELQKDLLVAQDGDWVLAGLPVGHNLPESDELVYRACRLGSNKIRLMTPSEFRELNKSTGE
ncbi:MAG TPA: hypothetical protein VK203_19690 [Nostocaceae cyanobacterium]|nr:hypothetical protein [Nostocaceae cyanobacterium]